MDKLYTFVYKGILSDESLDKAGRKRKTDFGLIEAEGLKSQLSYDLLDSELLIRAEKMSLVYTAIHTFENTVRRLVKTALAEEYEEVWWEKVSEKVKKKVNTRMEEESKFKWHGARGGSEIEYCDFGDLSSIIVTNWSVFEDVLVDLEWTKTTLSVLERSRNIVMHGGLLDRQDIERIGNNIRDWIRQAG